MVLSTFVIFILFFLSAFFSASETALFSLTRYQIRNLENKYPSTGKVLSELLSHPRQALVSILLGNTLVNVTLTALMTAGLVRLLGDWGAGLAIGLTTFLLLIFAEVTPKSFGIRYAQRLVHWIIRPLFWFVVVTRPIRSYLERFTDWVLSQIGVRFHSSIDSTMNQKELRDLIRLGRKQGVLDKGEEEMIGAVFELGQIPVKEVMIPRVDMVSYSIQDDPKELIEKIRQSHHSRIVIYQDTIDNILGVVHTKQFLTQSNQDIKTAMRPVLFVPEMMKNDALFSEMRKQKTNFAIVVDEYGGTSGLVTLEDILEEIVGDIYDEYDRIDLRVEQLSENQWLVHGMTSLRELQERLELELPQEEAETVGGLVLSLLGRFPKQGERIRHGMIELVAEEVGKKRIQRIRVIRLDVPSKEGKVPLG